MLHETNSSTCHPCATHEPGGQGRENADETREREERHIEDNIEKTSLLLKAFSVVQPENPLGFESLGEVAVRWRLAAEVPLGLNHDADGALSGWRCRSELGPAELVKNRLDVFW